MGPAVSRGSRGWSYYRAIEHSRLAGFEWLYFAVRDDDELLAVVPAFVTDYRLDTTLTGPLRRVTGAIARVFPRLLHQRLLSLGSPIGEVCHLGFAAALDRAGQVRLLDLLFSKVEKYARRNGISMLAAKDATMAQDELWAAAAAHHGLRRQPGLPTALLDIRFDSLEGYLATLSRATRKDLRRKLKASVAIRVEWRDNIDDIIDEVMRLYRATLAHSALTLEELTPEFFTGVLRELGRRSSCATYWLGDRLVAFNLVLHDSDVLLDKFLGMDYRFARRYNLYYLTWLTNIGYCIEHGVERYQSGQGLHREKLRLGSRLSANWLWYRHRNRVCDAVFAAFERLFRLDRHDPELAAMLPQAPSPPCAASPRRVVARVVRHGRTCRPVADLAQVCRPRYRRLRFFRARIRAGTRFALALGFCCQPHRRIPGLDRDPAQVALVGRVPDTRDPLCRNDPRRLAAFRRADRLGQGHRLRDDPCRNSAARTGRRRASAGTGAHASIGCRSMYLKCNPTPARPPLETGI
jgi:hypothetical protein